MLRNVSVAIHWGKKEKVREEWGEEGRRKTEHSFEKKKKKNRMVSKRFLLLLYLHLFSEPKSKL